MEKCQIHISHISAFTPLSKNHVVEFHVFVRTTWRRVLYWDL